jgi:3-deoxy-D-manno-octulosonic-acid transferase
MLVLYDFILFICAIIYLPVFLLRRKLHPGFGARLGALPQGLRLDKPVWIHAVSVGEAASIRPLVEGLRRELPAQRFVFSTVTPTGNTMISSVASPRDFVTYLPLDFSAVVRKFLRELDPVALVIVETELWPNLIYRAARKGIPIIVVNGRISDASFARYNLVRFLVAPLLNRLTVYCVQSERDAAKLTRLGLDPGKIRITGNMKFDITTREPGELRAEYGAWRLSAGIESAERLLVAASTHQGEESQVLASFTQVRSRFPRLKLLIAPRHPQRCAEVEDEVRRAGLDPVRISTVAARKGIGIFKGSAPNDVFILDTVGKLMYFFAIADIVFVGGSLTATGGHNILEPASLGKPVLFGPHMFNFRDIAALFLEKNAAIKVADAGELSEQIALLLADPSRATLLGDAARRIIADNKGATQRNAGIIKNFLPGRAV